MPNFAVDPPVLCRVIEARAQDVARVALRIEAPYGTAGRYSLVVRKADPAGKATMQQSGNFELADSGAREVGELTISIRPGGQLIVDASVQVGGRKISCSYDTTHDL
ncbi:curli-like amyloid fiber formation chaperone CsgH [Methylobacterium sp. Leaf361]|uniref:curli-like amyloid fiber formation chaperone CsgH n=1 Tax=Methylobacterium sp. Leaf361 TaxID=1736352 RepID=UPI000A81E107|nr:curli-like amyloid fiber formation chaperone CsgH [Methylobacterium sp. Leaf361]